MALAGKYEILSTLGPGSMGTVHVALDTLLQRRVALKVIRAGSSVEPEIRERFYREARVCARLQHPNIVTIFDLGHADDMAYIAMELLEGADLKRCISEKRSFSLVTRIDLMIQVCEALDHAHRNEVVHRDVKPSNIFIQRENRAKVLDFGIARLPSSKLTLVGKVLGTPNYMAPEQILGRPCDGRSDLFSAAVVFFEFLTGVHPFQSTFIPRRIANDPPEKVRDIDPNLPASLESTLATALQKDPERRFQTGEEFATSLKAILGQLAGTPATVVSAAPHAERPAEPVVEAENQTEWQISEFLRLLHDFDSAAELQSVEAARSLFEEMRQLESKDDRFTAAVCEYEDRLRLLEQRGPSTVAAAVGRSTEEMDRPEMAHAEIARTEMTLTAEMPAFTDSDETIEQEMFELQATRLFTGPPVEPAMATARLDSRRSSRTMMSPEKRVIVAAIAFVLALVLAAAWYLMSRQSPQRNALHLPATSVALDHPEVR